MGPSEKICTPREEALRNVHEAAELYLESLREHDEAIPPAITEEVIEL